MSAEDYKDARELVIKQKTFEKFNEGVKAIKSTILSYGFSKAAVDNLQLTLREFAMHLGENERSGGAYHYFADGKPFYEMQISVPGSLMEVGQLGEQSPTVLSDKDQALILFFEMAINLSGSVGAVIQQKHGVDKKLVHTGGGMPFGKAEFDTAFRCDPALYLDGLNDLVDYRLSMIAPRSAPPPPPPPSPKGFS